MKILLRVCDANVEQVQDTLKERICDLSTNITTATAEEQYRTFNQEELAEELHTDGLGDGQKLFTVRGFLILPGLLTTDQTIAVQDEPFTVDDYNASGIDDCDFDYNFKLSGGDESDAVIVGTEGDANIKVIWNEGIRGLLDTGQPLLDSGADIRVFKSFGHEQYRGGLVALGG